MSLRRFIPRFRFSLRTMMIAITIVAIVFGVWGKRYYDLRERYAAQEKLASLGFQIDKRYYDMKLDKRVGVLSSSTDAENDSQIRWDRFWFGEEYANPVVAIHFGDDPLAFQSKNGLFPLPNRASKNVVTQNKNVDAKEETTNISALISRLKDLERIKLNQPLPKERADISFLSKLPKLNEVEIDFEDRKVTDLFINELSQGNKLKKLSLRVAGISPAQMKKLILRSPELEELAINCASFDETCIEPIRSSQLTNLKLDNYSGSKSQQNFIEGIVCKKKWESLHIRAVTDLADDASLSSKELHFKGTQIVELICDSIDSVSIEGDTELQHVHFSEIDRLVLKNNAKLERISADRWKQFSSGSYSGNIGGLKYFELDGSPLLTNLNCQAYEAVLKNLSGMQNLVIRQCTQLEGLPKVTGITVRISDVRLAKMLTKLPALRRVDFYDEGKKPPQFQPNSLRELSKSTTIQDILIQFDPHNVPIVGPELQEFKDLHSVEIFNFSQIFNSASTEFPIALPVNLKKLYIRASKIDSHSRIRELLEKQHPNLDVTISQ